MIGHLCSHSFKNLRIVSGLCESPSEVCLLLVCNLGRRSRVIFNFILSANSMSREMTGGVNKSSKILSVDTLFLI